ncbi:MAG: hypothetical protein HY239_13790, partial [Mycolicibacterium aromaticivorans]|nr:hypothetical protein [Mycolicibacterium aromaticivorans]
TLDALIFLIVLPFMVMWPFWLLAKWCGVPWTIITTRDGEEIGREQVKGWARSRARMEEIIQTLRDGMPYSVS